jgi:hypothetical protein
MTFGRISLHAGKVEGVRRAATAIGTAIGGVTDVDKAAIDAGVAALEGRTADAIAGYRAALAGYRDYGCRFDLALAVFDMVVLLGPDEPAVASAIPEARAILVELGATALLERFEAAVARGGRGRDDLAALADAGGSRPGSVPGRVAAAEAPVAEH